MRAALALLAAALSLAAPAQAATFTTERLTDGRVALHMHGVIQRGDEVPFTDAVRRTPAPVLLLLDSPGGDVWSSLEIGRRNPLPTEVQTGERCASGCAAVWASGAERYIEPDGHVGFHRVSTPVNGREVEVPEANAVTRAYYARLGFSQEAINLMHEAPPSDMHWVDDFDTTHGIGFAPRAPTKGRPFMTVKVPGVPNAQPTPAGDPVFTAWIMGGDRWAMPQPAHTAAVQ